jgi:outer membrane receptor protein involved in Fe transport
MDSTTQVGTIFRGAILAAVAAILLMPVSGLAQVDEIVVTVRKKEENLQDVPMAVTAFTTEDIERKGIKSVADVANLTPSIQFDESFAQSDTRIVVRGLSPTRGRQNIALLVDGIDVSSEAITSSGGSLLLNTRLIDVERIEVVLGPQMALYGRSAFNGALQYVTKDAAEQLETELRFDLNDQQQYEVIAGISAPLFGDALGFRLNGTWWDDEGFYENTITNKSIGGQSGYGLALTLNSDICDNLSFKFRTEFTDDEGQPSAQAFIPFNSELPAPANAFAAGVAECFPGFTDALGTIPGNNDALLARGLRILDPAYVSTLDPATLDPNSPNFIPPAGGGAYCQAVTPSTVGVVPDGKDLKVTLAPNPITPGQDYAGFERQMLRTSLVAEWRLENWTFESLTGFTHDDNIETQDTNAFAFLSSDAGAYLDGGVNTFSFNNSKVTEQFSQELRVATNFDGPLNATVGGLYWTEDVDNDANSITTQASGSHCFWDSQSGTLNPVGAANGCTGYTATPVAPYQNAAAPYRTTSPVDRNTDHWSVYGLIDFEIAESWTLTLEGRYNNEDVEVFGPVFYDPGASGGPGGLNPCGIFFRPCQPFEDWRAQGNWFGDAFFPYTDDDANGNPLNAFVLDPNAISAIPDLCAQQDPAGVARSIADGPFEIEREADGTPVWSTGGQTVAVLDANGQAVVNQQGTDTFNPWCVDSLSDSDDWFSPKITLDWAATDDMLFYFSWSRARKPGGFGLLTVGSSGLDRDLTEFEPEKMEVWEVGGNSAWFDTTVILNGAIFFQDFTDKQALTSALGNDGRLVSKIENAGSAEVWGAEADVEWRPIDPFLGGNWRLNAAVTYLDTEYTDFTVASGSPVNAAAAGNCTPVVVGGETLCSLSYTGNKLEDAPEWAATAGAQYLIPVSAQADAFAEVDMMFQDKRFAGVTNNLWTDAYFNLDLRLGLQSERWEAMLYVDNVLEDDTVRFTGGGPGLGCCFILGSSIDLRADPSGTPPVPAVPTSAVMVDLPLYSTAFLPPPRIVGMRMNFRFGN